MKNPFKYFSKTRDDFRDNSLTEADQLLEEAGSLFDEVVRKMSNASVAISNSIGECEAEVEYHKQQIKKEEELKQELENKSKSVKKVISNIKSMFLFDHIEEDNG